MKDEEYVFYQDVKEKKSTGRGAFHKKGGSKSKKCTLPHEYLSKKEREAMNSECKTWNMNKFYTWEEFKQMPADIAAAYISTLNQKYKVSMMNIAEKLFHIGKPTFSTYIHKKGIRDLMKIKTYNNRNLVEFENAIIAAKVAKDTVPADIFIPAGMAPGYCSDGTKVEDAIREAEEKVNKKLLENGAVSLGEAIDDLKKGLYIPTPWPNDEEPLKIEYEEIAPIKAHIGYMELSLDRFDVDIFKQLAGMFEGDDVTVHIRVQRKIEDTCCVPVR